MTSLTPRPAPAPRTILIADDEPVLRDLLSRIVTHLGFAPVLAVNGVDAIESAHQAGEQLAAAILDIAMPQLGGIDAAAVIRAERPNLPIILMSARRPTLGHQGVAFSPTVQYFPKPFTISELEDALRSACVA